jgi:hypothetical protein
MRTEKQGHINPVLKKVKCGQEVRGMENQSTKLFICKGTCKMTIIT